MSALEENKLGTERVSRLVGVHGIDNGLIPIVAYNSACRIKAAMKARQSAFRTR